MKQAYLTGTSFKKFNVEIGMCLVPITGIGYFQMEAPKGNIVDDDAEMHLAQQSPELGDWARLMNLAFTQAGEGDIDKILETVKKDRGATFDEFVRTDYSKHHLPS